VVLFSPVHICFTRYPQNDAVIVCSPFIKFYRTMFTLSGSRYGSKSGCEGDGDPSKDITPFFSTKRGPCEKLN